MSQRADASERILARRSYRVPMGDVDAAGVLYYAACYPWKEQMFTTWLADIGRPLVELLDRGCGLPCVASGAEYHRPVRLDDVLEQVLVCEHVGNRSLRLRLDVVAESGELAVEVRTTNVWVERDQDGRQTSAELPAWLREQVSSRRPRSDPD